MEPITEPTAATIRALIEPFLRDDIGRGDITSSSVIPAEQIGRARIEARQEALIAGVAAARSCFDIVGEGRIETEIVSGDGEKVRAGDVVLRASGPLREILVAERTALNVLARISGVASLTARYVATIEGTPAKLVDTRKTTPGLRLLEKYAVRVAGGHNHRFGLDDGILIKDNHVAAAGSIGEAVARARAEAHHGLKVEVEVPDLEGLDEALAAGADAVLLDNMTPAEVSQAVTRAGGKVTLEASGGITLENVRDYAETGVDLISVGALTHSAPTVDLSLEVEI